MAGAHGIGTLVGARVAIAAAALWLPFASAQPPSSSSSSGGSSWQEVGDVVATSQSAIPPSNTDLVRIRNHANAILALAQACNAAKCPVVETCGAAGTLLQALTDASVYLDATEAALNRAAAAAAAAHNSVAGQAGISTTNIGIANEALGLKQYLTKIGAMLFDLASLMDDIKNLKGADPEKAKSTIEKIDQAYETLKDAEALLNDAVGAVGDQMTKGQADAPTPSFTPLTSGTAAVAGAVTGTTPSDATMGLVNDLKSSVSDAANAFKDFYEQYEKNGKKLSDDMVGGLAGAAAKITFRALKAKVDQQIRELEDYIKDLEKNLDAEQQILGRLFRERMRIADRRNAATDARAAVSAARAALIACMARACGLPTMTRPSLPDYYSGPKDAAGAPIPQPANSGWGKALADLNGRLAAVAITLEIRFSVKDICPGGGTGTFVDPGGGGTGFVGTGGFQLRNVVKTNCAPCQPIADAMARVLDEKDFYEQEARRIERSLDEAREIRTRLQQLANELAVLDRKIAELKEIIAYGQTPLGNVAGSAQQQLAGAMSQRAQLVSQRSALQRDLERLEAERKRLPEIRARLEALLAQHAELHAKLRYCEEDLCRLGYFGELDTWINVTGNNPLNPSNPIGSQPGADGRPVATVSMTRATGEGGGVGAFTITLSRPAPPGGVFVTYSFEGSAALGLDYAAVSVGAQVPPGATSVEVTVTPIDDSAFEGTEEVHMTLRPGQGYALGVPSRAVMPFSDNDVPNQGVGTIQFAASSYGAAEGAGTVTITVQRVGGIQGAVGVRYATGGGSATPGADFQATSGELAWAAGEGGTKSFTVAIVDDNVVEGNETFQVNLSMPTGAAALGLSSAGVTITDNDVAGPCGSTGSAWTGNAGSYACSGNCVPCPSPQSVTINGDIVTVSPFHAGGAATFQGCGNALTSQSSTLTYFGQSNHRATITRTGDRSFNAVIQSSGGGSCQMSCFR